ncbi:cell adhesion molecule CEACAM20-like isoform X2 [Phascolarctos cinereus]
MAFLLSWQLCPHGSWKVVSFHRWFRGSRNSTDQFSIIRPGDRLMELNRKENPDHIIMHRNGSLTLKNLSSRDSGLYIVEVHTLAGINFLGERYIRVHGEHTKLTLTLESDYNQDSTIELKIKSTVTFHCITKSHPVTSYHWTFNGSSLDHTGDQLTLHNVSWAHQDMLLSLQAGPSLQLS